LDCVHRDAHALRQCLEDSLGRQAVLGEDNELLALQLALRLDLAELRHDALDFLAARSEGAHVGSHLDKARRLLRVEPECEKAGHALGGFLNTEAEIDREPAGVREQLLGARSVLGQQTKGGR
jgi:hypothetical protein